LSPLGRGSVLKLRFLCVGVGLELEAVEERRHALARLEPDVPADSAFDAAAGTPQFIEGHRVNSVAARAFHEGIHRATR